MQTCHYDVTWVLRAARSFAGLPLPPTRSGSGGTSSESDAGAAPPARRAHPGGCQASVPSASATQTTQPICHHSHQAPVTRIRPGVTSKTSGHAAFGCISPLARERHRSCRGPAPCLLAVRAARQARTVQEWNGRPESQGGAETNYETRNSNDSAC